jgi:hypothetical protein
MLTDGTKNIIKAMKEVWVRERWGGEEKRGDWWR